MLWYMGCLGDSQILVYVLVATLFFQLLLPENQNDNLSC